MTPLYAIGEQQEGKVRNERNSMGHQRSYAWEFKLQMVHLLEKGDHNPSQISRDHHVTRSLLYDGRAALSRAGRSGLRANSSLSQSTTGRSTAPCTRTDGPSGAAVWAAGSGTRVSQIGGRCAKKAWHEVWRLAPIRRVTRHT